MHSIETFTWFLFKSCIFRIVDLKFSLAYVLNLWLFLHNEIIAFMSSHCFKQNSCFNSRYKCLFVVVVPFVLWSVNRSDRASNHIVAMLWMMPSESSNPPEERNQREKFPWEKQDHDGRWHCPLMRKASGLSSFHCYPNEEEDLAGHLENPKAILKFLI